MINQSRINPSEVCAFAIFQKQFPKAELIIAGKGPLQAHLEELAEELGTTPFKVSELRSVSIRPASLDSPIGFEQEEHRYGDLVQDENAENPYAELEEKTNTALLRELVDTLPHREQAILRARFGLNGENEQTLEEIGKEFGVTRERIRQIQNVALSKLKRMIQKREMVKMAA